MKKLILLLLVGSLVISGFGATGVINENSETVKKVGAVSFSENLLIQKKSGYLSVDLGGTDSFLMDTGKPVLPVYHKTFMFSSAVKIKEVVCHYSEVKERSIVGKIIPAPEAVTRCYDNNVSRGSLIKEDKEIYESDELFPGNWYDYSIRCGLNSRGVSTTFVTVEIRPVQYAPAKNMLYYVSNAKIQVTYDNPGVGTTDSDHDLYDMVIIAPEKFSEPLQPLIDHKNAYGVNTILKTTEKIYGEYTGRDKPEQIKYFIKDAKETWNITYVLLVGGLKSYIYANDKDDCNQGSIGWHVPVRYTNIQMDDEVGCLSDIYYADVYRYNEILEEWEFEDWDSNGDGVFAKWTMMTGNRDTLDLVPDVYVGRLACRNKIEVKILVNKIINYETSSSEEKPWFKKMIGIGGKTFEIYEGQPDGEYLCDVAIDHMGDLVEPVRVYASNRDTGGLCPVPEDIVTAISEGAGYVCFEGHGNPMVWDTIWHDGEYPKDWAGGISVTNFPKLSNGEKLPVVIVGGCHNGLFNISMLKILLNREDHYNYYWMWYPIPVCFSWGLCLLPWGGAIASTGCTGYGIGWDGQPISLNGELEMNFFYQIGQNNATTLGCAHGGSIQKFITENPIEVSEEVHCVTVYQLFGDPSLKLGGYP